MLSTSDLVEMWEQGCNRPTVARALLLLSRCGPKRSGPEVSALSIGQRNQALLGVHERMFGDRLECRVACPECGDELEFELDSRALASDGYVDAALDAVYELREEDVEIQFRVLDSHNLAAASRCTSVEHARQVLVGRSVLSARRANLELAAEDLPASTVAALADELERVDPSIVWRLSLTCDGCGSAWSTSLDLVAYVWKKVASRAGQALSDVHELASAYGWSEAQVLGLSDARRQAYLGLVRG
jgi:hypothetical protein